MIINDVANLTKYVPTNGTGEVPLVFWDGYGLDRAASGVFVHARMLANALRDTSTNPVLLGNIDSCRYFEDLNGLVVPQPAVYGKRLLDSKLVWPERVGRYLEKIVELARVNRPVVLHGLSNLNLPLLGVNRRQCRTVLTVHDLIPLLAQDNVSRAYYWQFRTALPRVLKHADKVVCVSDWTRRTIADFFPQFESKCVVIKNGLTGDWQTRFVSRSVDSEKIRLVSIMRFEPYKNIPLLLDILRAFPNRFSLTLVTCNAGLEYLNNNALDLIKTRSLQVLSQVTNSELQKTYESAHIYVHPSKFEGYCLPAAEAMTSGLPVVYMGGSGIDEVVGSEISASLNDGASPQEWGDAIERAFLLLGQPDFKTMVHTHLQTLPTWKDAATALNSVYNEVV